MTPADVPAARLAALTGPPADALVAAALFLVTLGPGQVLSGPPWLLALQVALVAPLTWRRRAPLAVLGTIGLAAAVQWALDVQLPADAALLVALYTVAAHRPWRHALPATLAVAAGAALAAARWAPPGQLPFTAAALGAMTAAAVMAGRWTRVRQAHVASLERDREHRARLAAAEERARIARDMHDIVTHNLSVMVALADSALHVRATAPDLAEGAMEQIATTGRQALQDMRHTLAPAAAAPSHPASSHPASSDPARSHPAPTHATPGIAQLAPLAERMRAAGLATRVHVTGSAAAVPAAAQVTIYRLVQEALTNTLRHSPGARAYVRLTLSPHRAELEVTDEHTPATPTDPQPPIPEPPIPEPWASAPDATPHPAPAPSIPELDATTPRPEQRGLTTTVPGAASHGRGIAGMRERVAVHEGTLQAGPMPGGWRVRAVLDLGEPR
ncbi:sensor histidine kinase [Nonomuraea soli]|uniref:histidine kinase n=1 Tax=Nonomuraea soli TaxID=1032476 RepID=A0A7W0CS02_9ACTN|nr:sensor histidine kinase [Nonomuraea soli]MBA2896133.1 signal transduction histidine kinase [Nonomuraea soli]